MLLMKFIAETCQRLILNEIHQDTALNKNLLKRYDVRQEQLHYHSEGCFIEGCVLESERNKLHGDEARNPIENTAV
jgi:hypothetical protein